MCIRRSKNVYTAGLIEGSVEWPRGWSFPFGHRAMTPTRKRVFCLTRRGRKAQDL